MKLFVKWTPELQDKFKELRDKKGDYEASALLDTSSRNLYDYIRGISRGRRRSDSSKQGTRPRKFVELKMVSKLADALDDPQIENVEALNQQEWVERGEWQPNHHKA